jgi:uncharacterized GH25 family protein
MVDHLDLPRDEDGSDDGDSRFLVRVLDRNGRPVQNREVALGFTSPMRGVTDDEFTDAEGIATFLDYRDGEAKIFVSGHDVGTYFFSHGVRITVTT